MNTSKDRILDAAERVVLRDGVAHLTLDAVAAEVQLSKGGVLYHFPNKEDLVANMLHRLIHKFEEDMARLVETDPCPKGRKMRAYLNASFPAEMTEQQRHKDRVCASLLAAVATNTALLEPVQEHFRAWHENSLDDGIDPIVCEIIRLAAEGLWTADLFGLSLTDPELRVRIVDRLRELTKG